ncbi:TIGR03013 family PEP-CTERM/XrtA system glycosyltransferase [Alkalimonas sp. MEB108]|uniref:TIGR03013 family PEP-CTERM/XrtA system glycosyltransferase n=1 Tax=Alkalimonas cellulosilytica TaxID=3058395 RepID=A0ABU7J249_9GAMM|nr:TIGR03013 family XrtA/PEP-CTERM system glycosyltransferase [Alkalimonas sp. MEB108]MEE2000437.1 TIGR03013 family PEP-CTERM/XrtA system glycosyltransferase [Alkalimonas sp. MEB108]
MNKATGYGKNSLADQLFLFGELLLLLVASFAASFLFHHFISPIPFDVRLINAVIFAAVVMLCALSVGLYDQQLRESHGGILKRVIITMLFSAFLLEVVVFNLFNSIAINGWYMLLACTIATAIISSFRAFFHYHDVTRISRRRVLILGAGERASIIERRMRRTVDRRNFEIVGFVRVAGDKEGALQNETILELDVQEELFQFVMENAIDQMVIACDERRNMLPVEHLFKCKTRGIDVVEILDFIEQETGQIAVNLIYPSWVIYSNGFANKKWLKTNLDYRLNFLLGLFVLALTWPIMVVTALLIYLEDGRRTKAPIFYKQVRVGIDGKPFHIIKFRSMRTDAEAGGAKWATKDDDRVTRVGRVIRKYRIDELPQLFNVFRGEMGFVGPRPERPEFVCELEKDIPYYAQRHNVKPGLTGWAQLKYPYGSTTEDALEKLKFDLYYIKHRSLLLDLVILVRTVEIVLFGKGR